MRSLKHVAEWVSSCLAACTVIAAIDAHAGADSITVYPAFGDVNGAVVEGRVVERKPGFATGTQDGSLQNLSRSARMFRNEERKGRSVRLKTHDREWESATDEEGYFRFVIPGDAMPEPGWRAVAASTKNATASGSLLVVPPGNTRGLISDLDDTILVTEVTDKSRMMRNTFLRNAAQREAVPGMAALYAKALSANPQPHSSPLIYLSASPRQLHASISRFLEINRFPRGVLITKRVTNDRSSEPLVDQFAYKTRRIEEIFSRLPGVRFVLVGDDGERDPEIYDWVRNRYPERVEAIWIRRVHPDPNRPKLPQQSDVAEVLREYKEVEGTGK